MKSGPLPRRDGISRIKDVRLRCEVDGQTGCWHWLGTFSKGKNGNRYTPRAHFCPAGRTLSVLRIVATLQTKDASFLNPAGNGKLIWRTCRDARCVAPNHLATGTTAERGEWYRLNGDAKRRPDCIARMTAKRRQRSSLTVEIVREILVSPETGAALADRFGLSKSHVSKIRLGKIWRDTAGKGSVFGWRP